MNHRCYRLVFSKLKGMLVAVAETASGHGKASHGETGPSRARPSFKPFAKRHPAFAALALFGLAPVLEQAQIVPSGTHAPNVIGTADGPPQANITRPSVAGMSLITFLQFDLSQAGAALNNSPVIKSTQRVGQISTMNSAGDAHAP
jgi:filamentous hemagglutinin